MIPSFRPAHDRVPLTVRDRRVLVEREFDVDGQATGRGGLAAVAP